MRRRRPGSPIGPISGLFGGEFDAQWVWFRCEVGASSVRSGCEFGVKCVRSECELVYFLALIDATAKGDSVKNRPTVHKRTIASGAVHSSNSKAVQIARRAARKNASALRGLADK